MYGAPLEFEKEGRMGLKLVTLSHSTSGKNRRLVADEPDEFEK